METRHHTSTNTRQFYGCFKGSTFQTTVNILHDLEGHRGNNWTLLPTGWGREMIKVNVL